MTNFRTFALAAAAFVLFTAGIVAQVFAATVTLRPVINVEGETVRLGDLFEGIAGGADIVIAAAPRPGQSNVLDAATLKQLAQRHGLEWRPYDDAQSATITRLSREIDGSEIEALMIEALSERLLSSDFEIELSSAWPSLVTAIDANEGPELVDLKLDNRSGRFTAQLGLARGAPADQLIKIAGRVVRTETIPVPSRSIAAGEVIAEGDIDWQRFRADRLGQNPVLNAEAIVGKAPRRALRPGVPVRASELMVPLVVQKGTPVTMVYIAPGIHLSMVGRALEGGFEGQMIKVLNPQSKLVSYGAVAADGTVQVTNGAPAGQAALDSVEGESW